MVNMKYLFGTDDYLGCITRDRPEANEDELRGQALDYIKNFKKELWSEDPIVTIVAGEQLRDGQTVDTVNAFNEVNGKQILATPEVMEKVTEHLKNLTDSAQSPPVDLREPMRQIEAKFLSGPGAGAIIGAQAIDYQKQDGVTEIVESVEANAVERQFNDAIFDDEKKGDVKIRRYPAFVGCVSNFTNFLDLFRKSIRNIELGVPVVIMSRGNTSQHMFRWAQLLLQMMIQEQVDPKYLTFVSCGVNEQRELYQTFPKSPMYFTGSRAIAEKIKPVVGSMMASTGGPNTMIATAFNSKVAEAARISNCIENKGQCTALRHLVVPKVTKEDVSSIYAGLPVYNSAPEALAKGECSALLNNSSEGPLLDGYEALRENPRVAIRMGFTPPEDISEQWRECFLDVTTPEAIDEATLKSVSKWLNVHQPISVAVNADDGGDLAMKIFESTSVVVYTLGTLERPALTAQARPQDGECFGEFPPRKDLNKYTTFPVIIPSSTPGYQSQYTEKFLREEATKSHGEYDRYLQLANDEVMKGYMSVIVEYLVAACGPKRSRQSGPRTALFGLQRPPIVDEFDTVMRCSNDTTMDQILLFSIPFVLTNAKSHFVISLPADSSVDLGEFVKVVGDVRVVKENDEELEARKNDLYNVFAPTFPDGNCCAIASHFVSVYLPMGHIKSVEHNDEKFEKKFRASDKWLSMVKLA
ncbi:hypothetical protein FOL47_000722 [Perkinsus chesapeaki]|uniref:Uncharacterized protein n=1 Tax=Perkinsus chesapeaki TaxID=330153 RepID=A0A7J6ML05_PERCH|nr:hypothetical protein FOL47_000722 [Perkinsus chesapeaki]